MTAVVLLACLVALLILTLAVRNEMIRFVLFFFLGAMILALWKVFTELPWWGWLLFVVATVAALTVWRRFHTQTEK